MIKELNCFVIHLRQWKVRITPQINENQTSAWINEKCKQIRYASKWRWFVFQKNILHIWYAKFFKNKIAYLDLTLA